MTTKYHQISINDIFSDCQNKLIDDSSPFLTLSEYLDFKVDPKSDVLYQFRNISEYQGYPIFHVIKKLSQETDTIIYQLPILYSTIFI